MLELLGALAVLAVAAIPIVVIALVVSNGRLRDRVGRLEKQVSALALKLEDGAGADIPETSEPTEAAEAVQEAEEGSLSEAPAVPAEGGEGPWRRSPAAARPDPVPAARTTKPPGAGSRLAAWLSENWFYAISALSLALAGIFLVQYGIESGLLSPRLRVLAALGFGAVLIGAGEWIRRRHGDSEDAATAYLPSTFSGAGIVSLFGGILSARVLYDLIGAEAAFAGLAAVAAGAILLGWFHGPLLVTVGVVGAMGAPFVVGGATDSPGLMFGYFGLVALAGLAVDAWRQWRWVSVLTLALAFVTGWLTHLADRDTAAAFLVYAAFLALAALLIPVRRLTPDHSGPTVLSRLGTGLEGPALRFETVFAYCAMAATAATVVLVSETSAIAFWVAVVILAALAGLSAHWSARAPGIDDLAAIPAIGLAAAVIVQPEWGDARQAFLATLAEEDQERARGFEATWLLVLGAGVSVAAFLRSMAVPRFRVIWAAGAAFYAPALAVLVEVTWTPAMVIGPYPWALHAMGLAALSVFFAARFAAADGADRGRVSWAALAGLACVAFGMTIVLSEAALTVALSATVVAAAWLDRKFDLKAMEWFLAVAVAAIGYRLVADPGLAWAMNAPLWEAVAAYGGATLAMAGGFAVQAPRARPRASVLLESAAWSAGGLMASVLLQRWLEAQFPGDGLGEHWGAGLFAAIWFGLAVVQLWRVGAGGVLDWLRRGLAMVFGFLGASALALGFALSNPLFPGPASAEPVYGPAILNTLAVAYLLPALVLLAGGLRLAGIPAQLVRGAGIALGSYWLFTAIRHFWQGSEGMPVAHGYGQPELYTYTMALLLIGAGLFYQSLARRSEPLRIAGLIVIGAAVAKVFLVDISGLGGLIRVFSLLALGLSLAGLAWLNRWARARGTGSPGED